MSDARLPNPSPTTPRSADERVTAGRMLAALRAGADVRRRKVRRLRAAVRARAYENALKLHVAVDRLTADLQPPPSSAPDDHPISPGLSPGRAPEPPVD